MKKCFAYRKEKNKAAECTALSEDGFRGYLKEGFCNNYGCPFYKPKGEERRIIRGLSKTERARVLVELGE